MKTWTIIQIYQWETIATVSLVQLENVIVTTNNLNYLDIYNYYSSPLKLDCC